MPVNIVQGCKPGNDICTYAVKIIKPSAIIHTGNLHRQYNRMLRHHDAHNVYFFLFYFQLNISARHRKQAQSKMESGDPTMFDEIQLEVFTLMERDSFPRFFFLNFIKQQPEAPKWICHLFCDVFITYCRWRLAAFSRGIRVPCQGASAWFYMSQCDRGFT